MKIFKTRTPGFAIAIAMLCIIAAGCSPLTRTQKGAAIGAGAGATVGAVIGKAAGNTALGSIIGGAIGGTAGAYIGHKMDRKAIELNQTIPNATLTPVSGGIIVKFNPGILFGPGMADLKSDAQNNLKNLATALQNNPQTSVSITGYADSTETDNASLSVSRAEAVKTFLVADSVSSARIFIAGKGNIAPVAINSTPDGRAQNRRVEIVIVANEAAKDEMAKNGK